MMRVILFSAGVTVVVVTGLMIDARSRQPARRPVNRSKQYTIFALGRVEGATAEIELRARLAGRIVRVFAREGRFVEEGEVLLQLDDEQYRQEVALAAAEVDLAEAQRERLLNGARTEERAEATALYHAKEAELERAQLSWQRIRDLRQARAISQQEADNQRSVVAALSAEVQAAKAHAEVLQAAARPEEVRMAEARIKAAKARLELAKVQLERTKLRAPSRGQILQIDVEVGELTGPTSPQPAVVLADTTRFRVRAFVEEMDAPRVRVGMAATVIADGLPGQKLRGRVSRLSPRMSRKELWSDHAAERYDTKTREVWIELYDCETSVVGLPVDVMIDPESRVSACPSP